MTMSDTPQLDSRSYDDVVAQAEALAAAYTSGAWRPRRDGSLDLGGALIRLFGTMAAHVIKQLNKVPDRHQRAFTGLLGAVRLGARAARAAITFQLDDGARTPAVPAGAEIAGTADDGTPVVFETELDLPLTRARLDAVVVHDAPNARYADRTPRALGLEPRPFDALGAPVPPPLSPDPASRAIEHEVYVAFDPVGVRGATTATVTAAATSALPGQPVQWAAFDGAAWASLPPVTVQGTSWRLVADAQRIGAAQVAGAAARWLRGSFPAAPPPLRLTAEIAVAVAGAPLDAAFTNGQAADFTRDVLVFGERPRAGDVFYLASDDAFAIAGAAVTLAVGLTIPPQGVNASPDLRLQWEAWDGRAATLLGTSTPSSTGAAPFSDTTKAFTASGAVTLQLGAAIPRSTIRGVTSRWVRVRIVAGNYGTDLTASVGAGNAVTITPASFRPPAVASMSLSWTGRIPAAPARLLRRTALTYEDVTAKASGEEQLYRAAPELVYQTTAEALPALHLGFDRAFEPTLTTLYFQVPGPPAPSPADYTQPPPPRTPPRLAWEYWNGARWTELLVEDGTRGLGRSGLVRFLPPADARPLAQHGRTLYWLRARSLDAAFAPMPRIGRISTNTVWASHAHTITGEVLGGSNGERDQVFTLSQTPVLEGQQIEVGEPDAPPPAELARLEAEESAGAVTLEQPASGLPVYWVRWHHVPDFYASGPRDRHYTLDAATGQIAFGSGTAGMIPPRGAQNIRAARYRAGGGSAGNVDAGALDQLRTTVPVVSGATNHEPAVGGAELEPIPALMDRAARTVRHGGRAVTAADFEDLALEASAAVGRAIALTPAFVPVEQAEPNTAPAALSRDGRVIVVIVPRTLRPGAAPATDALAEVEDYLRARCAPGARIDVTGPTWIAADITVHLVARSLSESDALLALAREAIARLFDPMAGGDGGGWPFGRRPRRSDVLACIDVLPGFDHASYIEVRCEAPFDRDDLDPEADDSSTDEVSLQGRLLVYARTVTVTHQQSVLP
jgi:hypothetical protein